jgi:hypothetical protein
MLKILTSTSFPIGAVRNFVFFRFTDGFQFLPNT